MRVGVMKNPRTRVFGRGVSVLHSRDPSVGRVRMKMSQGKDSASNALGMSLELGEDFPVGAGARKGQDAGQECEAVLGNAGALGLWCVSELAQGQGRRG